MRYAEAIGRLFALQSRGIRMGVSRTAEALEYRGHPEAGMRFVHVAGTNGKGSVASMIAEGLRAAGYRTGLFTSPHLHRYVERVRVDGRPLAEREAARRITDLLDAFERPGAPETTFFELTTLLALERFRDARCDVAVLEVGLGGRLDATNAVSSLLTVITRIALDHVGILGPDLRSIAREKAGILERGAPLVTGVDDPGAWDVIRRRARSLGVPVHRLGRDFRHVDEPRGGRFRVDGPGGRSVRDLALGLDGAFQRDNAALAVAGLSLLDEAGLRVPEGAVRAGLARVRWPGRLEEVRGAPPVLLDAAHNLDGCTALARHLAARRPCVRGRMVLVFGTMADKDHQAMARALAPYVDRIVFTATRVRRAAQPGVLATAARGAVRREPERALALARSMAGRDGLVIVAGSLFLVAELRAHLLGLRADPLIRM